MSFSLPPPTPMRSFNGTTGEAVTTLGTCAITAFKSSMVSGSVAVAVMRGAPPMYSAEIRLAPMAWIWFRMYCLPVMPMVTTRINEAVPITMPSAVRANRTLLLQKVS